MLPGIWSRNISHSAKPRKRSRRRSRPSGIAGAGGRDFSVAETSSPARPAAREFVNMALFDRCKRMPEAIHYLAASARFRGRTGYTMYRAVTRNIQVTVEPRFLPERSSPDNGYFFWAYTIEITNSGSETVQLRTRHWRITDALGRLQEVKGAGVVGEEPVLKAGESFEYTSGVPLPTPSGFMSGSYGMTSES